MTNKYFEDWNDSDGATSGGAPIFDGGVMDGLSKVHSKLTNQGLVYAFNCPNCSTKKNLVVEWHELIAIGNGLAPQYAFAGDSWTYDPNQNAFYPTEQQCSTCGNKVPILITMTEAARAVNNAIEQNLLQKQIANQINAKVLQVKQSQQGR